MLDTLYWQLDDGTVDIIGFNTIIGKMFNLLRKKKLDFKPKQKGLFVFLDYLYFKIIKDLQCHL